MASIMLLGIPLYGLTQKKWAEQSAIMAELRESKTNSKRAQVYVKLARYFMLREYYLYKTGNPRTQLDSASWCAQKAVELSETIKDDYLRNEALVIMGDTYIRKNEITSARKLLPTLPDSTRFRLLILLARHYLFHKGRLRDVDSSLLFLQEADKISIAHLSPRWQTEKIHVLAMRSFITEGLKQSISQYQQFINIIRGPGNEEREALLWHELSTLIPLRSQSGVTRLHCFENMRALYRKTRNQEREAWVLKSLADIHQVNGELDRAESELLSAIGLYQAIGYTDLHYLYDLLAINYRNKGELSKSISYALKAVESVEATNEFTSAFTFYGQIANMYRELGLVDKSVEWYSKMAGYRTFEGGDNFYKFRDAGFFARELVKIKREKEALTYLLDLQAKNKPVGVHAEAWLIASLAYCYQAVRQEQAAEKYYTKLIKLASQLQQKNEITTNVQYEIGEYFLNKKQYATALTWLERAQNGSATVNSLSLVKDIHLMLYRADSGTGNWNEAMHHLWRHKLLSDSMFNENKNWQIEELQIQYETAAKQKNIDALNNQNQLERIKVQQAMTTRNITLAGLGVLAIILCLLLSRYWLKQKTNRKLEVSRQEVDEKNKVLETLNIQQEKLLHEKEWLLREVHHRVKNNLQMVTSLLNTQTTYLEDQAAVLAVKDSLRRMQAMSLIHQKLYQGENISAITMPGYINDLIHYLSESLDTDNRIVFHQNIEPVELDIAQAIPLGLIINEAVVNALKYAFPDNQKGIVDLSLKRVDTDQLLLSIADNGIGLQEELNAQATKSLGLDLMRGLATQLNGSFSIHSNHGVQIEVKLGTADNQNAMV